MVFKKPQSVAHEWLEKSFEKYLYKIGVWISNNRLKTHLVCFVVCIICCVGFLNITTEYDGEDLWVPSGSISRKNYERIQDTFGSFEEYASILFVAPNDGNILTLSNMDTIWSLYSDITSLSAETDETYENLCSVDGTGLCEVDGILKFWRNDYDTYQNEVTTDDDLLAALSADTFPDGTTVSRDIEFGNLLENDDGTIESATAIRLVFVLLGDGDSDAWQQEFLDYMEEKGSIIDGIEAYYIASRSIDDEIARSVTGEIFLFILSIVIMVVFTMFTLGRCHPVHSRAALALLTLFWILLSGVASYGFCAGVGVPFTSLQQVLPFLLIGIGLDDAFIIALAFDEADARLPTAERVGAAFGRCGLSVCYTSAVNFIIFMLGANSSLPAISYFCLYAGVAVLFDILIQVPTFLAMLAWDSDRQNEKKFDLLCCIKKGNSSTIAADDADNNSIQRSDSMRMEPGTSSATSKLFKNVYLQNLMSVPGCVTALLITFGLIAFSLWGIFQLDKGLDVLDLVPDTSYSREYFEATRDYEMEEDDSIPFYIVLESTDMTDINNQAELINVQNQIYENKYVTDPVYSWFSDFLSWCSEEDSIYTDAIDEDGYFFETEIFYTALDDFLADSRYERYKTDIIFDDDGNIEASRVVMYYTPLDTVEDQSAALLDVRDITEASSFGNDIYAFSGFYIGTEGDIVLEKQVYFNFLYGLVVVFIFRCASLSISWDYSIDSNDFPIRSCSTFILGQVRFALLVCFLVAAADLEVMAFIYFWNLKLNTVTAIQLIMAAGLITDLIVHIAHYYSANGTGRCDDRKERIIVAAAEIGPSVLFAGLSTFIGILPMALATNAIFRTFFKMLVSIISLGAIAGLISLPVILLFVPERKITSSDNGTVEMKSRK